MINIRCITLNDAKLLWEWANDRSVRDNAYNKDYIEWDEHINWLKNKLASQRSYMFIAEENDVPIGQVRFDLSDELNAVISISIEKKFRGEGFGSQIIKLGTHSFLKKITGDCIVHAYVKNYNIPSIRAFENAGYVIKATEVVKGEKSKHLIYKK